MSSYQEPPLSQVSVSRKLFFIVLCGGLALYIISISFITARHNAQLWEMTNRHNAQIWDMTERHNAQLSAMLTAQADKYQIRLADCRNEQDQATENEAVAMSGP